ncbi:hypothetical protein [Romboutsia ilealis]|uniref:hypothetical protein n=1 Tax=Romboutsia ilealis TaxID=1115758 RepID=UPI00272BBAAC|nr:hypothetical protein [Romboutsia ilealis]
MEELYAVTEVGMFGDLEVQDPTKKKVKRKSEIEDVQDIIEAAILANKQNL